MSNLVVVPNWEDANEAKRQLLQRFSNLSSVRNGRRTEFYRKLDQLFGEFETQETTDNSNMRISTTSS